MNILTLSALAEAGVPLTQQEALAAGAILGASVTLLIASMVITFVIRAIADWRIFTKAGRAGWKSLIPVLCEYEEYDLCWTGRYGLIYGILMLIVQIYSTSQAYPSLWLSVVMTVISVVLIVMNYQQSMKLSRAFGKGTGFGWGLFLLGPIFRLILGFGSAQYRRR